MTFQGSTMFEMTPIGALITFNGWYVVGYPEHNQICGPGFGSTPAIRSINWSTEAGSEYSGDEKTRFLDGVLLFSMWFRCVEPIVVETTEICR